MDRYVDWVLGEFWENVSFYWIRSMYGVRAGWWTNERRRKLGT